jgi:hypothetical protein
LIGFAASKAANQFAWDGSGLAGNCLRAIRAEPSMPLEALVQIAMSRAQSLDGMHLLIVSVRIGEEPDQLCFELFIRMAGGGKQCGAA